VVHFSKRFDLLLKLDYTATHDFLGCFDGFGCKSKKKKTNSIMVAVERSEKEMRSTGSERN